MLIVQVKIINIEIPPRFRVEYGDLESTKKSIKEKGLINPITVSRLDGDKYRLVAGMRRILCCQQLGIEEVPCSIRDEIDEISLRELEIIENLERKQFTWPEELRATETLVELREKKKSSLWSTGGRVQAEIAEELGVSEGKLSEDMMLARGLKEFPELAQEEKRTTALKKLKSLHEQRARKIIAGLLNKEVEGTTLIRGDSEVELDKLSADSVNLIITDPPWGVFIENDEFVQGYIEKFEDAWPGVCLLLSKCLPKMYRVLAPGSHMYFFFATKMYCEIKALLVEAGFEVAPIPLIWYKKTGQNIFPQKKFTPTYETIFFCSKGDRSLNYPSTAVFEFSVPSQKVHPTQKPQELLEEFIKISSVEGEVVLDPFAGSGSTLMAGKKLGRKVIGIELSEHYYNVIKVELEGGG